jgi:DNA-directed RNA polymerase specialized sigma24 family protein
MKRERDPTPEEFEKLLFWLDPDRDQGGNRLKQIQSRLIKIFASRGCVDAESLADEVLNRVAVRIDEVIKTYPDPLHCCLGFLDNVYREYLREERMKATARQPPARRSEEELEREDRCLAQCLAGLPGRERDLIVVYFHGEKRAKIESRRTLATRMGFTANALRIHAHRIRTKLRECLEGCLQQQFS